MKKKLSLPIVIAIALICASIAFSLAYVIALNSVNAKLTDLNEKQSMFSSLAEADDFVRKEYREDIDEKNLSEKLIEAYVESFGGKVLYLSSEEFEKSGYTAEDGYAIQQLSNGKVIVIDKSVKTVDK